MAKNSFPGLKTGGSLPKLIGFVLLGAFVVLLVKYPADTAGWLVAGAKGVGDLIDGVATFLRTVFG